MKVSKCQCQLKPIIVLFQKLTMVKSFAFPTYTPKFTKLKRELLPGKSYLNKATQNILSSDIQHIWREAGPTFIHWKHTTTTWWLNFDIVTQRVRTLFWTNFQGLFKNFQGHISHFSRTPFGAKKSLESTVFFPEALSVFAPFPLQFFLVYEVSIEI